MVVRITKKWRFRTPEEATNYALSLITSSIPSIGFNSIITCARLIFFFKFPNIFYEEKISNQLIGFKAIFEDTHYNKLDVFRSGEMEFICLARRFF